LLRDERFERLLVHGLRQRRPPLRVSTAAAIRARRVGCRKVIGHTSGPNRSRVVSRPHSGLGHLVEGQKISYQFERGQQGKTSAVDLQAA
jgi:hypothetical protein